MRVRWTKPASEDLQRITRGIRRHNPTAAREVATTLYDGSMSLEFLSGRGRKGRIMGTRELVLAPYVIVYRIESRYGRNPAHLSRCSGLAVGNKVAPKSPYRGAYAALSALSSFGAAVGKGAKCTLFRRCLGAFIHPTIPRSDVTGTRSKPEVNRAVAEHRLAGQLRGRRHTSEELRWRERPAMLNQNLIFAGECAWFRAR